MCRGGGGGDVHASVCVRVRPFCACVVECFGALVISSVVAGIVRDKNQRHHCSYMYVMGKSKVQGHGCVCVCVGGGGVEGWVGRNSSGLGLLHSPCLSAIDSIITFVLVPTFGDLSPPPSHYPLY